MLPCLKNVSTSKVLPVVAKRFYSVRVRFAPSPTGSLHLGGFRTALLNYIFAKKHSGDFILRIEDTDQERAIPGAAKKLEEDLVWLNIPPTESPSRGGAHGPYTQSERIQIYKQEAQRLLDSGAAYHCFCTEMRLELLRKDAARRGEPTKYDGKCRSMTEVEVRRRTENGEQSCIRFKHPPPPHKFTDVVYGPVVLEEEQGDFVILKSDGFPTYHLASVVDDHLMEITHVLRGFEWQVSTGKHVALYRSLGYAPPAFAHLPLILNRDGSKLSKRQSDISIDYYRNKNYFPEALVNFVMGNRGHIEPIEEIASKFELESYSRSNNKMDFTFLEHLNQICLRNSAESNLEVLRQFLPGESDEYCGRILKWCPQRITKLADLNREFPFLSKNFKSPKLENSEERRTISLALELLESSILPVNHSDFKQLSTQNQIPMKMLMHVLRKSLCAIEVGPPVAEIINLLGKDESLRRLKQSLH